MPGKSEVPTAGGLGYLSGAHILIGRQLMRSTCGELFCSLYDYVLRKIIDDIY